MSLFEDRRRRQQNRLVRSISTLCQFRNVDTPQVLEPFSAELLERLYSGEFHKLPKDFQDTVEFLFHFHLDNAAIGLRTYFEQIIELVSEFYQQYSTQKVPENPKDMLIVLYAIAKTINRIAALDLPPGLHKEIIELLLDKCNQIAESLYSENFIAKVKVIQDIKFDRVGCLLKIFPAISTFNNNHPDKISEIGSYPFLQRVIEMVDEHLGQEAKAKKSNKAEQQLDIIIKNLIKQAGGHIIDETVDIDMSPSDKRRTAVPVWYANEFFVHGYTLDYIIYHGPNTVVVELNGPHHYGVGDQSRQLLRRDIAREREVEAVLKYENDSRKISFVQVCAQDLPLLRSCNIGNKHPLCEIINKFITDLRAHNLEKRDSSQGQTRPPAKVPTEFLEAVQAHRDKKAEKIDDLTSTTPVIPNPNK